MKECYYGPYVRQQPLAANTNPKVVNLTQTTMFSLTLPRNYLPKPNQTVIVMSDLLCVTLQVVFRTVIQIILEDADNLPTW